MKRRVLRWYDYSWSRGRIQGGGDINTALGLLPDKLKTELALHVNLSVLKKVRPDTQPLELLISNFKLYTILTWFGVKCHDDLLQFEWNHPPTLADVSIHHQYKFSLHHSSAFLLTFVCVCVLTGDNISRMSTGIPS